ncbi:UNVERIFIED_CONTAM: Oleosin [Sesamum calycinum]|uniref:Oleosin n=1 Tax=Sesamum calycinum TaxID=2727403 RepID=A0AAW2MKC0_9LAMI
MADRDRPHPHQIQVHPQQTTHRYEGGVKSLLPQKGPPPPQILAIITLLPISGTLLCLAGITLVGTLIGLAVATPVFVIFSPVLVPAAILIAGAVTAFLTSGAFGLTGLSSLSWVLNSFRRATGQDPLDYAKRRVQEGLCMWARRRSKWAKGLRAQPRKEGEKVLPGLEEEEENG